MDQFFSDDNANSNNNQTADPTADFLAREQAALGDDHAFVTGALQGDKHPSNTSLTGDDYEKIEHSPTKPQKTEPPPFVDTAAESAFQSEFPPVEDLNEQQATQSAPSPVRNEPETESDALREWRQRFADAVAERDRKSEQKHKEQVEAAKQAIDKFYEDYNVKKQKAVKENRENESQQAVENASGTVWEKIAREVDAAAQAQAKSSKAVSRDRLREVLSDLRKDNRAPGQAS